MLGCITCLSLSALYHLFCCHSLELSREWNKLDYIGIVVMIVTSFFTPVFYGTQPSLFNDFRISLSFSLAGVLLG